MYLADGCGGGGVVGGGIGGGVADDAGNRQRINKAVVRVGSVGSSGGVVVEGDGIALELKEGEGVGKVEGEERRGSGAHQGVGVMVGGGDGGLCGTAGSEQHSNEQHSKKDYEGEDDTDKDGGESVT